MVPTVASQTARTESKAVIESHAAETAYKIKCTHTIAFDSSSNIIEASDGEVRDLLRLTEAYYEAFGKHQHQAVTVSDIAIQEFRSHFILQVEVLVPHAEHKITSNEDALALLSKLDSQEYLDHYVKSVSGSTFQA